MTSNAQIEPTVEYIQELVPLRYPVLLVDRVLEWVPGERITAVKLFSGDDSLFGSLAAPESLPDGVPEALMIESMVQVAGLTLPKRAGKYVYLLGLNRIHVERRLRSGETLVTTASRMWNRGHIFRVAAVSCLGSDVVVSGEVSYAYLDTE